MVMWFCLDCWFDSSRFCCSEDTSWLLVLLHIISSRLVVYAHTYDVAIELVWLLTRQPCMAHGESPASDFGCLGTGTRLLPGGWLPGRLSTKQSVCLIMIADCCGSIKLNSFITDSVYRVCWYCCTTAQLLNWILYDTHVALFAKLSYPCISCVSIFTLDFMVLKSC